MPEKPPRDINRRAKYIVDAASGQTENLLLAIKVWVALIAFILLLAAALHFGYGY